MSIIDFALDRGRATLCGLVLILVAGTLAYLEIPKEDAPDIAAPVIHVSMSHGGISARDAERLLVLPMEQALRSVEGLVDLRAAARAGGATLTLEFDADFDEDKALDEVREKVDEAKTELPADTTEPVVSEVNLSLFPVLVVSLGGALEEARLLALARDLRDRIESEPDILEARLTGERDELVEIVIDPIRLESYGLDTGQAITAMRRANRLIAAGTLDQPESGRFAIKVPGLFTSLDDIAAMPLVTRGDAVVRVRDVAQVRRTFKDRGGHARLNGRPALSIEVSKRIGTNIIEITDRVRALAEQVRAGWPTEVQLAYSQDKSTKIRNRIADLQNSVVNAVLLVMIVLIAALGFRSAGLVGVAIPGAFLLAILALSIAGVTANTVVLFALILSVGMLVDGAIVVSEYADRRIAEGMAPRAAYALSAKHMSWPVIASTGTTLAAFLPLAFWPGLVGEFIRYLPLTVLATLSASLAMALIFLPVLGGTLGRRKTPPPTSPSENQPGWLTRAYLWLLARALAQPVFVVIIAIAGLLCTWMAYDERDLGAEFFPKIEPTSAVVLVHARGNLSTAEQLALTLEVETIARRVPGIQSIYTVTGTEVRPGAGTDVIATLSLEFQEWDTRPPAREILAEIRAAARHLPGIEVETRERRTGPAQAKPIQIELTSDDPSLLVGAALPVRKFLLEHPDILNVEDTLPPPAIEWRLSVDRERAARFGADMVSIGEQVRLITTGVKLTEYRPHDSEDEIDVVIRLPETYRSLDQLGAIRVQRGEGWTPIDQFVTRRPVPRTGTIHRIDGRRAVVLKADIHDDAVASDVLKAVKGQVFADRTRGVKQQLKGEDEDTDEAETFLIRAFLVALFIMAIILVTQFNSFYRAFLVLSAVVMSTIGVLIGLMVLDRPFGIIMSGIGVIALAGIVVNNNIILIDTFARLSRAGMAPREALLETGRQRLRPVLLTTVTTVVGLMPLVLQTNIDFLDRTITTGAPSTQLWVQLSSAIVFGLSFATLLTLLVTPAALMLQANIGGVTRRQKAWWRAVTARLSRMEPMEAFITVTAVAVGWVALFEMTSVRIFDITSKQILDPPSVWFQAVEWAVFWVFIALTFAYGYLHDAHVRVDIIRERLSPRWRARLEIVGVVLFLWPVCAVVIGFSLEYVYRAYMDEEKSWALLGAPVQWGFKALMPIGFALLAWVGWRVIRGNWAVLRGKSDQTWPFKPSSTSHRDWRAEQ